MFVKNKDGGGDEGGGGGLLNFILWKGGVIW